MKEREIFDAALAIADPDECDAFLNQACNGDPGLKEHLRGLLEIQRKLGSFLESPDSPPTMAVDSPQLTEGPGTVISPYKLMEQIGEGGMGVVYVAEQTQPVRRKVALKIIKPGMDTKQVIARFEAERQALAMMDHPNIAKVHDGGTTDSGRPYFVMELVRGVPITEYCDDQKLTIRERLELFVLVCRAVQHAHQKGIIHRDLKPSNILVTLHDGVPVPKVIDFGVAKATGQSLTERTIYTAFTQLVGTPLYMSPEQVELSGLDVDTRSDIYSLGVLLYELLTGTTPFDAETLKKAAFDEMRRIIREEEPPKPSTRLSTLGATLMTTSSKRSADPRQLNRSVQGELDWISMKALEKDRRRRYETANDFASDVMRYLTDQPVSACPPSAGYRLRKFVLRNKGPVAAGLALAALLVLGTVGTSIGLVWALRAETKAKEEAAVAKAVKDFLQDDLLAEASPEKNARHKKVTVEEVLGRAAARVAGKFAQQPRIEAEIQQTIGDTYRALGDYTAAEPHLERALEIGSQFLGKEHLSTLKFMNNLAELYGEQGKFAQAEPLLVQALEVRRRLLGKEHRDTLTSMSNLAEVYDHQGKLAQAEPLFVQALEVDRRVLGEEDRETLTCMSNLAGMYQRQGQFAQAEPLHVQALEVRRRVLGEEHRDTFLSMNKLGGMYRDQGKLAQAEPLHVQALEVARRVLGEEHPHTLVAMNNLASLYCSQGKHVQEEPLAVQMREVHRRVRGEEHPDTLRAIEGLANVYSQQRKFAQAEPLLAKVLEIRRRLLGEEHPDTLRTMANLAVLYDELGELTKAEALYVRSLEIGRRIHGETHPDMLTTARNLAYVYLVSMRPDRSIPLYEDVLKKTRDKLGPDHPDTLETMARLGDSYRCAGRLPEATELLEQAWAKARKQPDPLTGRLDGITNDLGLTYEQAGQPAKAESLYREAIEMVRRQHKETTSDLADLQAALGRNLLNRQRYPEAEPLLRECLKFREQVEADDYVTFYTKSALGGSLLGQKKHTEAEPLLLAGYDGMKLREGTIPPIRKHRMTEAIEWLVQLYDTTGKKDKAAEWRARLPAAKTAKPEETKKD